MFARFREIERLEELKKKKMNPAHLRGKKECVKCGFCCHKRTCIPSPTELKKIAEFLKMGLNETIKKYFAFDKNATYFYFHLKPLGKNILDLGGQFIPANRTWNEGKCIFLDEKNKCKIYLVRPKSARTQECWKENKNYDKETKELNELWKESKLAKEFEIEELENEN